MSKKTKSYRENLDEPIYTPTYEVPLPDTAPNGESKSVTLKSGGMLTLWASTKFMALDTADRAFVFELIDKLGEYEKKNTSTPGTLPTKPADLSAA